MRRTLATAAISLLFAGSEAAFVGYRLWPGPAPTAPAAPRRSAAEERAAAIAATKQAIALECQRSADGDWDRWEQQLGAFRVDIRGKIASARPNNPMAPGYFEARDVVLEGRDQFPLFESAPGWYLQYLIEPECLNAFRTERPVVAAARWLRRRGIDLIFVPVPKMTEVYPEYFSNHCPPNHLVAPHVRRLVHDLLEADVAVVDLLPQFLEAKRSEPDLLLYLPADPHWNERGKTLAVRALAERLKRYDFVADALNGSPVWVATEGPFPSDSESLGSAFGALSPTQQRRALAAMPRSQSVLTNRAGGPLLSAKSPIVFIGDSYNCGLVEMAGRELNLPVQIATGAGQTTQAFKDFVRDPELLKGCRVVVWVDCNTNLQLPWPLPPVVKDAAEPQVSSAK